MSIVPADTLERLTRVEYTIDLSVEPPVPLTEPSTVAIEQGVLR